MSSKLVEAAARALYDVYHRHPEDDNTEFGPDSAFYAPLIESAQIPILAFLEAALEDEQERIELARLIDPAAFFDYDEASEIAQDDAIDGTGTFLRALIVRAQS